MGASRSGGGSERVEQGSALEVERRPPGFVGFSWRLMLAGLGWGLSLAVLGVIGIYVAFAHDLPRLDAFEDMEAVGVTRFEAADGSLVGERFTERRLTLKWEELPRHVILAFLAAEDGRFFEHAGLDFRGILRAMVTNLVAGGVKEGASTITQQLVKMLVGSQREWSRKVKEAILARRMEDVYSKEQILTWYINVVYFGHRSYGVGAAAQNYFRKNVAELSLAEAAMLAGCPQSPSRVNPAVNLEAAKRRTAHVLRRMQELGWASEAEVAEALAFSYEVFPLRDIWGDETPAYSEIVRRLGPRWQGEARSYLERGLTLEMAVDPAAQRVAEQALAEGLSALQKKQGWPGPVGRIEDAAKDVFFQRNKRWVRAQWDVSKGRPRVGARLLGRVGSVVGESAQVALDAEVVGRIALATTRWAVPWTIFPRDAAGEVVRSGKVSFEGKVKGLDEVLAVGDVVLVRVVEPPPPKKPTAKKTRKRKGGAAPPDEETAPALTQVETQPSEITLELEPIPMMEGAVVSARIGGSGLDALVPGWDFDRSQVDRTLSRRPSGSTMKAFAYAMAYDLGLPPSAKVSASEFVVDGYRVPGKAGSERLVWDGLVQSDNPVSARTFAFALDHSAPGAWQRWGEALGLPGCAGGVCPLKAQKNGDKYEFIAEVFGASQRPRDLLTAFATLGDEGRRPTLGVVRKVTDRQGRVLERNIAPMDPWAGSGDAFLALAERASAPPRPSVAPTTAYLIAKNLAAAVAGGTGRRAGSVGREVAGKTGTLPYDVWFSGFTAERATVMWFGADANERPLGPSVRDNRIYGAFVAGAWADFMRAVDVVARGAERAGIAEVVPRDVVTVAVDPASGLLARDGGTLLPHRVGTEPKEMVPEPVVDDSTF